MTLKKIFVLNVMGKKLFQEPVHAIWNGGEHSKVMIGMIANAARKLIVLYAMEQGLLIKRSHYKIIIP